jgi:hypothetical protein
MKDVFAFLGAFIVLFCTLPYIIDIVKGKTKPNIVTWITWTVLIGIGTAALYASGEINSALFLTGDTLATFAVVLVGLKYGIAKLDRFDLICMIGAIVGLILWLVFNSPIIAILATILIDFIGTIPTVRHSYLHPEEETYITFALGIVATIFTLFSLHEYSFSAWIYPAYLLFSNGLLVVTIVWGQRRIAKMKAKP